MKKDNDYQKAAQWAHELTRRHDWCILDTETTGLGDNAEICQIAICDCQGNSLLNTLVKPTVTIEAQATKIHGINNEMLALAPTFDSDIPQVDKRFWMVSAISLCGRVWDAVCRSKI